MSRIAPDIPELQHIPEALRSIAYMRALNRAIRAPLPWLLGALACAIAVGAGVTQGRALLGTTGVILGALAGTAAAVLCFFKLILPWQARRVLPTMTNLGELEALDHVHRANQSLDRMFDSNGALKSSGRTRDPRDPKRLP